MNHLTSQKGFTMVELLVAVSLFGVVSTAGFMLLVSGQASWVVTQARVEMQEDMRLTFQRLGAELQESGENSAGTLQVFILESAGSGGSDIIRFSVPICPCGVSPIDENGDVAYWGAPLNWGQAGCSGDYTYTNNGKVKVCHLPPGNPSNTQTLRVSENAVKAHMAHGDWLGDCGACSPTGYANRYVEYQMNSDGQLLRRVLDTSLNVLNEDAFSENVTDFQVELNAGQTVVSVTVSLARTPQLDKTITFSGVRNVSLRNKR